MSYKPEHRVAHLEYSLRAIVGEAQSGNFPIRGKHAKSVSLGKIRELAERALQEDVPTRWAK